MPIGFGFDNKRPDKARQLELSHAEKEREEMLKEKEALKAQGIDLDEPQEQLTCPGCGTSYEFGNDCPDCGLPLVGDSAADDVKGAPPPSPDRGILFSLVIPGVLVILGSVALWLYLSQ